MTMKTQTIGVQKGGTQVVLNLDLCAQALVDKLQVAIEEAHAVNVRNGWWHKLVAESAATIDLRCDYPAGERPDSSGSKNVGDQISLIHTEVSEAYEGHRTNSNDDKLPEYHAFEVELADAVIRIFDTACGMKLRLAECIAFKLAYNSIRRDHTIAARLEDHGKKT